jgi:xanthine dehydrogenase YagR molybdenum-binding subunit
MTVHLKHDKPDERNLLDRMAQGVIGAPLDRPEGPLKVSGTATYAAEYRLNGALEGVFVGATIVKGKVLAIDDASVLAMPGVVAVISDKRMIARAAQGTAGEAPTHTIDTVRYWGQPVALVVADTLENARDAAKALAVEYASEEAAVDPEKVVPEAGEDSTQQGDLATAMEQARACVDITYTTKGHASAAMEPHAAVADWDGETLTVRASLQMLNYNISELADAVELKESQVRLLAPYVGGGFGSKLGISQDVVAASLAAMHVGKPVRVVMTRQQVFQTIMRRSETRQRLRLAASKEGIITGIGHEAIVSNLPGEEFSEPVTQSTAFLYGGEHRVMAVNLARVHRMTAGSVRAPGEAVGMPTLEAALDELSEKLEMDPVDLRLRNLPDKHPVKSTPFASRKLAECLEQGAAAFGWEKGPRTPRSRREGEWWIGTGVASAARVHTVGEAKARVMLRGDGTALVQTDMTDIGTGTYAILGQIAAEMLGLDPSKVDVQLGDTRFPRGPGSGGSWGAASIGSAVSLACEGIRDDIARRLKVKADTLKLKDGQAIVGDQMRALSEIVDGAAISVLGHYEPGKVEQAFVASGYGAFFAEVAVNHWTGETRVRRMTGAFGFGRVLNAKTARSQCIGGMVWCIGSALTEALEFDPLDGHLVNCDLAEYHVPVHRDVPSLEVIMVEERDPAASAIQAKGIGELGMCGGAGAIANAIYNASGARMRAFPMTPDRVLAAMPPE